LRAGRRPRPQAVPVSFPVGGGVVMRRQAALAAALLALAGPAGAQDKTVAIMGGTLLTAGPQGTIARGTILLKGGKIVAVGPNVQVPPGTTVINAEGMFVTPGIIDAHSHTAIEDSVNECTDSVTAEVRIADVLDHRDIHIYRELAGGVT